METRLRQMSLTEFRADASAQVRWVEHMGGQVWIRRHGKVVAAVVPFTQIKMLEPLLYGVRDVEAKRVMMERDYANWKRAIAHLPPKVVTPVVAEVIDPERAAMMAAYEQRRLARVRPGPA